MLVSLLVFNGHCKDVESPNPNHCIVPKLVQLTFHSAKVIILPHRLYEVGKLAVDWWAVTFGTARRGLGGIAAHPGPSSLYQM